MKNLKAIVDSYNGKSYNATSIFKFVVKTADSSIEGYIGNVLLKEKRELRAFLRNYYGGELVKFWESGEEDLFLTKEEKQLLQKGCNKHFSREYMRLRTPIFEWRKNNDGSEESSGRQPWVPHFFKKVWEE